MDEKDKAGKGEDEDTEGNMPFSRLKPEGTGEENAEGEGLRYSVKSEGTEEDAEGEGYRLSVKPEGAEEEDAEGDDAKGHRRV